MRYKVTQRPRSAVPIEVECEEISFDEPHVVRFQKYTPENGTHDVFVMPFADFDSAELVEEPTP